MPRSRQRKRALEKDSKQETANRDPPAQEQQPVSMFGSVVGHDRPCRALFKAVILTCSPLLPTPGMIRAVLYPRAAGWGY